MEQDLGVLIQDNLKVSEQCLMVATTVNKTSSMINRRFSDKSLLLVNTLCKSLIDHILDYCAAWRPLLKKS